METAFPPKITLDNCSHGNKHDQLEKLYNMYTSVFFKFLDRRSQLIGSTLSIDFFIVRAHSDLSKAPFFPIDSGLQKRENGKQRDFVQQLIMEVSDIACQTSL